VGELLEPGLESNLEAGRTMSYGYSTATLDAATWGAGLAQGEGRGRIYPVAPTGEFEDDPHVTDSGSPGTRRSRSAAACRSGSSVNSPPGLANRPRSCR
jgi:rifampin ADP-ribosylating transferase